MRRLLLAAVLAGAPPLNAQPAWRVTEVSRYGDDSRAEAAVLDTGAVARTLSGDIVVAQRSENDVRLFHANGQFVSKFGRAGDGPGEFRSIGNIGLLGDTLWVADRQLDRVTFFSVRSGKVLHTADLRVRMTGRYLGANADGLLREGSAVGVPAVGGSGGMSTLPTKLPLLRFTRDGRILDTLTSLSMEHRAGFVKLGNGGMYFVQPLDDSDLYATVPGGTGVIVVRRPAAPGSQQAQFTASRFGPNGKQVWSRTYAYKPTELTKRAMDSLTANIYKGPRPKWAPPIDPAAVRAAVYRPAYYPPITGVVAGEDGSIWLRGEATPTPTVAYRVLDVSGTLVATVTVPSRVQLRYADARHVWGFTTENDEPKLVRYLIQRSK